MGRVERPEALEEGTQPPDFPEDGWSKETEAVALKAAQNIAMALAGRGEEGFRAVADPKQHIPPNWQDHWTIPEKILYRVALLSDRHIIGGAELKLASHCGGIMPYSPWLRHCKGTSACADPGNPTYGEIVMMLFSECIPWRHKDIGVTTAEELRDYDMKTEEQLIHYRFECYRQLNEEHRADCVEAALAAADYAYKVEQQQPWTYEDLQGGVWGTGDIPS